MIRAIAAGAVCIAALAGCSKGYTAVSPPPATAIANGTAQGCLATGDMFTPSGRQLIQICAGNAVTPKNAHKAQVCAHNAISATVPAQGETRHDAVQFALAQCLLRYRKA